MPDPPEQRSHIVGGSRVAPDSVDLADALVQGVRAGFGILSLGLGIALRTLGESPGAVPRQVVRRVPVSEVADILLGTAWGAARLSGRMAVTGTRIVAPMMGLVARPPLVPRRLQPAYRVQRMTEQWQHDRPETLRTLGRLSGTAFPGAIDAVLDQVDVDQVATVVLDRVDLTRIVSTSLDRLNITEVTLKLLSQLDIDEVALKFLSQLDINEVAVKLLSQLDINEVATQLLDELDIDEVATLALNEVDLTQLVLDRVDLQRVVAGALEGLDLTAVVVDQVDLGAVVAAALEKVDLTAIVMQQVDLVGLADYVVDAINLPEIIRESTGSVASEAVVGMRMQGIDADAAVGRVVDRMLRRRRQHPVEQEPGRPDSPGRPEYPPTRTRP